MTLLLSTRLAAAWTSPNNVLVVAASLSLSFGLSCQKLCLLHEHCRIPTLLDLHAVSMPMYCSIPWLHHPQVWSSHTAKSSGAAATQDSTYTVFTYTVTGAKILRVHDVYLVQCFKPGCFSFRQQLCSFEGLAADSAYSFSQKCACNYQSQRMVCFCHTYYRSVFLHKATGAKRQAFGLVQNLCMLQSM